MGHKMCAHQHEPVTWWTDTYTLPEPHCWVCGEVGYDTGPPPISGHSIRFETTPYEMTVCWAALEGRGDASEARCTGPVRADATLGLCQRHIAVLSAPVEPSPISGMLPSRMTT